MKSLGALIRNGMAGSGKSTGLGVQHRICLSFRPGSTASKIENHLGWKVPQISLLHVREDRRTQRWEVI